MINTLRYRLSTKLLTTALNILPKGEMRTELTLSFMDYVLKYGDKNSKNLITDTLLGYDGHLDTTVVIVPLLAADEQLAIDRLTRWSQHSDATPLDGTDRDSPTFGNLRTVLSLVKQAYKLERKEDVRQSP